MDNNEALRSKQDIWHVSRRHFVSIILSKTSSVLPEEIITTIQEYFWDIKSLKFARHASYRRDYIMDLHLSLNRANGFGGQECVNTEDQHWIFYAFLYNGIPFQAVNCSKCGNYQCSHEIHKIDLKIKCYCNLGTV
jgi:hypothetical protein